MTETSVDTRLAQVAAELDYRVEDELRIGGNYVPAVAYGNQVYISGQVPRVGSEVVVAGRVGAEVALERARYAARVCAMRALTLLRQSLGDLARVRQVLRITVFVQCTPDFTQHSEVADAASDILQRVLGAAGTHTRTSVGVCQLPKNAAVELDLIAAYE